MILVGMILTDNNSTILVYSGVFTFLVDAYPTFAASALAANSFSRSSFGGIFPLFGIQSKFALPVAIFHPTDRGLGIFLCCQAVYMYTCCCRTRLVCFFHAWLREHGDSFAVGIVANGRAVYNNLGFHWATTLLAFLTLIMTPFP